MRSAAVLSCVAFLLIAAVERPGARPAPPQYKSGVTLLTIDVTVLDRDGRPVPDLAPADFEVKLDGRVRAVRAATSLQAPATQRMSGAVGPSFDAITPAGPPAPSAPAVPHVFVILVDDFSFPPLRGRALFAAAQRFVAALPAADRAGLATTTGTRTVNPTTDRRPVLEGLASLVGVYSDPRSDVGHGSGGRTADNGEPDHAVGISQALAIDRGDSGALEDAIILECFNGSRAALNGQSIGQVLAGNQCASTVQMEARRTAAAIKQNADRQLQSYQSIIRAMQTAAGPKHLVLLTDGIGLAQDVSALAAVARVAAEAGVQLSVLVESADASASDQGRRAPAAGQAQQTDMGASQRRREDDALFLTGAKTVADNIGAMFHHVVGSPDPFFARVALAAAAVYRLAVEAPVDTSPGKEFALSARVKRPGITTVANRRAIAPPPKMALPTRAMPAPSAPMSIDEQLRNAIATGRPARGFEVVLARTRRRAADASQVSVDVAVDISTTAHGPLTTVLGIVDADGAIRTARSQVEAPPPGERYHLEFSLPLTPGVYKLRFAAADASGAVGSVESAVDARLPVFGTLSASDLLIRTADAAGRLRALVADAMPPDARTLAVALELYGDDRLSAGDLLVKIAVAGAAGDAPPAIERIVAPEAKDGALVAEAEFPLDRMPAGSYTLRATVLSDSTVLGTLSAPLKR